MVVIPAQAGIVMLKTLRFPRHRPRYKRGL